MISGEALGFALRSLTLVIPIFVAGLIFILILKRDHLKQLNVPVDFGISLNNKRLFGVNKTWRGVLVYVVISIVVCYSLAWFTNYYPEVIHPIYRLNPFVIGLVFSVSYVGGELMNSFVKRQLDIAPGESGYLAQGIVDNVDGMIVTALVLVFLFEISVLSIMIAIVVGLVLHLGTDVMMRRIGLKE